MIEFETSNPRTKMSIIHNPKNIYCSIHKYRSLRKKTDVQLLKCIIVVVWKGLT